MVRANGISIYYEMTGEGERVVLIGGLGSGMSLFASTIRAISNRFRTLAFDNRGVGRTDKPDAPYTIEQMAEDTAGLMTATRFSPADVVGVSMGGRIAMALALKNPEMVKRLVLVSTSARTPAEARNSPQIRLGKLFNRVTGSGLLGGAAQPYYAFMRQLEASRSYDCTERLGEIQAPTLIMNGAKDELAPPALADQMHSGIRGSQIKTFDGGHVFFLRDNKRFTEALTEFLGA